MPKERCRLSGKKARVSHTSGLASRPKSAQAMEHRSPRSLRIAGRCVKTGGEFAALMSAMMCDVIEGRITPSTCNAACNAGSKLLKVVEMQLKYGSPTGDQVKHLVLAPELAIAKV